MGRDPLVAILGVVVTVGKGHEHLCVLVARCAACLLAELGDASQAGDWVRVRACVWGRGGQRATVEVSGRERERRERTVAADEVLLVGGEKVPGPVRVSGLPLPRGELVGEEVARGDKLVGGDAARLFEFRVFEYRREVVTHCPEVGLEGTGDG